MTFASAYSKKTRSKIMFKDISLTKQSQIDEADINKIISRHTNTGVLADLDKLERVYGEITATDLLTANTMLKDAHEAFMEIPSAIRSEFDQNVGAFIDYATDPENITQMREWGLAKPASQKTPADPEPSPEPTPEPPVTPTPEV